MNYYQRHIGDYMKDASHLSLLEHGVYTRLLDAYYSREAPIPQDQAYRLVGARSKEERAAVDSVLAEFFKLVDGSWQQKRCEEVLKEHLEFIASQKAKAAKRWHANGNADGMPEQMPRDMQRHSNGIDSAMPPTPNSHSQLPNEREDANAPPRAKVRKPKGAHRVPDDFAPDLEYARSQLTDIDAEQEAQRFRDFEFKSARSDWPATWRNWIRTCRDTGRYAKLNGGGAWR